MLPSNKTIWNIAYPIMIGNLAQTLIALTDTAFLGRISEVALGASSMAAIYYYVFSTLAWGFAVGVQVIIARRFGEANYKRIGVIFEHGLYVVSLLGVFLFVLLKFLSADILRLLISSDNVYHVAMQFINYRSLGIFFVCINFLFRSLYIGVSNTKIITYTTLVMAVVNILFNYLLIFGHWGFPNLGVQGAAIASVFAEVAATIFFVVYTLKMFDNKKFTTFKHHKIEPLLFKRIFSVAIPTMMQKLISFGTWLIFFSFLERMGERALASSMTVRSAYMMIAFPVFAFGATSNTLVSRIIGEGNAKGVEATIWRIFKLCCLTLIPLSLFAAFFPNLLLGIYTDSSELIAYSRYSIYAVIASSYGLALGFIFFEAISGTSNTHHGMYIEIGVLITYIFVAWLTSSYLKLAVEWVWMSELTYGVVLGLSSMIYLSKYRWQDNQRINADND